MLVQTQIHLLARESDALEFQAKALFRTSLEGQLNFTTGAEHTVPWKEVGRICAQQSGDRTMVHGVTCRGSHLAVSGNLSLGNGQYDLAEPGVPYLIRTLPASGDLSLELRVHPCHRGFSGLNFLGGL